MDETVLNLNMETLKTNRGDFHNAIKYSEAYFKANFNKNTLSYYSEKFLEANQKLIKNQTEEQELITNLVQKAIKAARISLCKEKNGEFVLDSKGGYTFTKENLLKLSDKTFEITEKLTKDLSDFFDQPIEVFIPTASKVIDDKLQASIDKLDFDSLQAMDRFIFKINKSAFIDQELENLIKGHKS